MAEILEKQSNAVMEWHKRPLEQWLEQYGSWLLIGDRYDSLSVKSILGALLDKAQGVSTDGRSRVPPRCAISDAEAKAIEQLFACLLKSENRKVKSWLRVVIMHYIEFKQEDKIAQLLEVSEYAVKRDKMLGIVRIATKHNLHCKLVG